MSIISKNLDSWILSDDGHDWQILADKLNIDQ